MFWKLKTVLRIQSTSPSQSYQNLREVQEGSCLVLWTLSPQWPPEEENGLWGKGAVNLTKWKRNLSQQWNQAHCYTGCNTFWWTAKFLWSTGLPTQSVVLALYNFVCSFSEVSLKRGDYWQHIESKPLNLIQSEWYGNENFFMRSFTTFWVD